MRGRKLLLLLLLFFMVCGKSCSIPLDRLYKRDKKRVRVFF
jgi:hypothetical protein